MDERIAAQRALAPQLRHDPRPGSSVRSTTTQHFHKRSEKNTDVYIGSWTVPTP